VILEPALRNDLVELIGANFKTEEVNELGRLVLGSFDSNEAAGSKNHVSISSRKSARALVDCCDQGAHVPALLKLVVEVDDATVNGKTVHVKGLEPFLGKLLRAGIHYDFKTRRIVTACEDPDQLPNWGCLKEGKEYDTAIVSLDIVDNSSLVREHGLRRMEKLYFHLWSFLREKLGGTDGRIWSWAGDGGILAFALKENARRAVQFALEVQTSMPVFNVTTDTPADIAVRLGIDTGKVRFNPDTGKIVSDVINYAAHLEKRAAGAGGVAISRPVYESLSERMADVFKFQGMFESKDYFVSRRRLDGALLEEAS